MKQSFHTCRVGYETVLAAELTALGEANVASPAAGVVLAESAPDRAAELDDLCFAACSVYELQVLSGSSVNSLAGALCDHLCASFRGVVLDSSWPVFMLAADGTSAAGRLRSVRSEVLKRLRARMARVARLARVTPPVRQTVHPGLGVFFPTHDRCLAGTRLRSWGQRRMRWDSRAPSRSYLKLEEALALFGESPGPGDQVADLGAAPGGWSFAAAERGAQVKAIDNGPLKGAAADHPRIVHHREDAFRFHPMPGERFDWLFCDLIEDPWHVCDQLLLPWVRQGWCRRFVVNLKIGRCDPLALLARLRSNTKDGLTTYCRRLLVRQLYHDRQEITCMGEVLSPNP